MAIVSTFPVIRQNMPTYDNCTLGSDYQSRYWVEPVWQLNDHGRITRDDWNGDRCIGTLGSVHILDKQWMISVSWGDGVAIRRINDNGTITRVWSSSNGNGYNHHCSLAVNEELGLCIISQYNTSRMGVLDISAWIAAGKPDDGAGIVHHINIYQNDATWNFPSDRNGTSYENGLMFAGDWLYIASYGRDNLNGEVFRWNAVTHVQERVQLANNTYSSNNWEGTFVYDSVNDKLFYQMRWSGGLNVIENASTASPTGYLISYAGHGSNHCTYKGVVYIDNNPNRILVGGEWRFFELDITNCGPDNATPIFLQERYTNGNAYGFNQYYSFGSMDPYNLNEYKGGNQYGYEFIAIYSDRGWLRKGGWFDLENFEPVGRAGENDYSHERDTWFTDYTGGVFKVTSANGTDYWAGFGYSWDGHAVNTYATPYLLVDNYTVTFGGNSTSEFSDGTDIAAVDVDSGGYEVKTQSGTSVAIEVSNNNGLTYETYAGGVHTFSSTGNKIRLRYSFTGQENKMPYLKAQSMPTCAFFAAGYENSSSAKTLNYKISGI